MKKLLTILTLALALCLLCGTALAVEHHSSGVDLTYNEVAGPDSLDITLGSPVEIEGNLFTPTGLSKTVLPKESSAWQTSLTYDHDPKHCVVTEGIVFSVLYDDGFGNLYTRAYNIQKADGHKIWEHEWGAPITKNPITCELEQTCDCCGAKKGTGEYNHTWQDVVIKEATCQEKGQVKRVCKVCGYEDPTIYDGLGGHHHFELHITPPQCDPETMLVVPGEAYVKCAHCDTYVEVTYIDTWLTMGDKIADSETTTDIWAAIEYGIDEARYQALCGEEVSAHDWTDWHEIDNDCEHPGYRIRYCNRCGHDESTMYPAGDPRNFPKTPNWEIVVLNEKGYTCVAEFGEDYIIRCSYCKGKAPGHKITKLGTTVGPDANGTTYTATENLVGNLLDNTYLRKEYTVTGSDGSEALLVHLESHVYKEEPAYLITNDNPNGNAQVTCVTDGMKYYRCIHDVTATSYTTATHYPLERVAVPRTGHNFGPWIMMEAPEVKADGTKVPGRWVRVCTNTYCLDTDGIDHQQEELKQFLVPCATEADHDWQPVTLEAFTCTKDGKTAEQCSKCLKIKDGSEKIVPAHHIWDAGKVLTAPTCTEEGVLILTCTVCKTVKNEAIPALGHDPKDVEEVPATCKDTGITAGKICDRCGIELEGFEVIPVTDDHDYVEEIVTEATCSAEGKKLFTCSVCGKTYTEAIEKIAHTPVDVEEVPATCKTEGVAAGKECSVCGEKLEGFEVLPVDENAHVWDTETVKEPTCTKTGLAIRTCSVCGKVEKDEIAALGHTWDKGVVSKEATKDEKGDMTYTCTVCGETKVEEGVVEYVVTAEPKYEVTELAYDGQVVTGKLVHVEDTLESETLNVRVTFFLEGNYYMATIGEVEADGTFAVEGVGPIEYISVQANGNSSVNPTEVKVLGANDLEVK